MLIKFNHAVHLDGKDYSKGVHEVPDSALKSKAFARYAALTPPLVEDGTPIKGKLLTPQEKRDLLLEKTAALTAKPKPGIVTPLIEQPGHAHLKHKVPHVVPPPIEKDPQAADETPPHPPRAKDGDEPWDQAETAPLKKTGNSKR